MWLCFLYSFPWLCGAYGLTAPTKKISRPHIYLTVKRGKKKSDVRRDLEDKFKCDAKEYFELLQEPKRKPKIKYLGQHLGRVKSEASSSLRAAPGGGVLACINNNSSNSNPLRVPEKNERDNLSVAQGIGTLTMFCVHDNQHYALTCFHVGCATDSTRLNATINKKEEIEELRSSLPTYVKHAKQQQYYFTEMAVKNNNESISFGDDGSKYTPLGDFHKYHFDNKCDIMSLKVLADTEIDCRMQDTACPNWNSIWDEFYERVLRTGHNPVEVVKNGFSSGLTHGHIVPCDFSSNQETESLFQDAIVVKGCNGPFLESGDSGALVCFHGNDNHKQAFAYGVCELDELPLIKPHESRSSTFHGNAVSEHRTSSVDEDWDDGSSTWSEDCSCSSSRDQFESEDEFENEAMDEDVEEAEYKDKQSTDADRTRTIECPKDNGCQNEFGSIWKFEYEQDNECKIKCDDENEYGDHNKNENESECEEDDGFYFDDDNVNDQSDFEVEFRDESEGITGPYYICLRLDTALENLGLRPCFSDCGSN